MFSIKFRDMLPQVVVDELDFFQSRLTALLSQEHDEDGTHTDVTADSVVAGSFTAVEQLQDADELTGKVTWRALGGPNGVLDTSMRHDDERIGVSGKVFRVESEAAEVHVDLPSGRAMALGVTPVAGTAVEQRFEDALTVMHQLRLAGQSTYIPTAGDTAALADETAGPKYSVYQLAPTGDVTIYGIYADLVAGNRGQVEVLMNNSAFNISFESAVVTNKRRIYGCATPVTIGPGGVIVFIYDHANGGWRYVTSSAASVAPSSPWSPGDYKYAAYTSTPSGWLLCDGSAVDRTTYADLFTAIGITYGAGNGTTTFNLPDGRGKALYGQAASGTGSTFGGSFGAMDHTHSGGTTGAAGGHGHTVSGDVASDGAHGHSVSGTTGAGSAHSHTFATNVETDYPGGGGGDLNHATGSVTDDESAHTHGAGSLAADSGGAHTHEAGSLGADSVGDHTHSGGTTGTANGPGLVSRLFIKT